MIGQDLGGRYEIISRIGGGGMALVYKAHDILLNRRVAVKVLRSQFVHDEEFIRRFRREAQSAASLSHPNVVSIYDVGQQDDIHYIVMEYIEGHNLNEIIQERAPLQTEEAVRIAQQICDALEHAHQNQIIHRDIKPHNILIGKNGRVKVTDFGIARAVTSATITQAGSVVGSVHYFSPEHAKGVSAGEQSDLYSLGVVLYQMLTGELPFHGESPISVALKHLQETFVEPRVVNPHIPQSVENIILRSMRKNPGERYTSAGEMLRDLETCLQPDRLNEPKLVFDNDAEADMDETRIMPAIGGALRDSQPSSGARPTPAGAGAAGAAGAVGATGTAGAAPVQDEEPDEPSAAAQPKKKWVRPVVTVSVTLVIIALVFWGVRTVLAILDVPEVEVPYVVGQTEDEARKMLQDAGLRVEEPPVKEHRDDVENGIVFDQSKSNMRVKEGALIQLWVSLGPRMEEMPSFAESSYGDAVEALRALGVPEANIKKQEEHSDTDPGTVINQSPAAGEQFDPKKTNVTLTVSKGPATFKMPDLRGKNEEQARSQLQALGLRLTGDEVVYEPSFTVPKGEVMEQYPYAPGAEVTKNAEVTLTVSSGPPKDAIEYTYNVVISPAEVGGTSEVHIVYSDARGENIDWGTKKINNTKTFQVKLVLVPNTEATVTIERDGVFMDSSSITYDEAVSGEHPGTVFIPGFEMSNGFFQDETPPDGEQPDTGETDDDDERGRGEDRGRGKRDNRDGENGEP